MQCKWHIDFYFQYLNSHLIILSTFKSIFIIAVSFKIAVPSKAPTSLTMTATSSTSIEASWQLPPADSRNGIIRGFKLLYRIKGSADSQTILNIGKNSTLTKVVAGLHKYTEYEFQVLAVTIGDGPKSKEVFKTTLEDGKYICSVSLMLSLWYYSSKRVWYNAVTH